MKWREEAKPVFFKLGGAVVTLEKLLEGTTFSLLQGEQEIEISAIQYDSRRVQAGDVFVCVPGLQVDGHKFAKGAVEKGATALICERMPEGIPTWVTVIRVKNARRALALASAIYCDEPSKKMRVIGVTGTNGKTTTTYLLQAILNRMGRTVGIIGTIENRIGDKILPSERTTPESKELQELLAQMYEAGVTDVVMEVSSHSLDLHRVDGISFDVGIFTNLTQDHLDYHKTMENYMMAKALLFQRSKHSIINIDDPAGEKMAAMATGDVLTFSFHGKGMLEADEIQITADGTAFVLKWGAERHLVRLNTPGLFSVYNALGAIGACIRMGIPLDEIIQGLADIKGVSGRFQMIRSKKGYQAVVDYAHTPDGLENILKTAREFTTGKILTVFGCGGDRDKTKRPIMGRIAAELSDYCIITSDNPRTESPMQIMEEVEVGVKETTCPYCKLADRREAIAHAAERVESGDVIIIAGKGHETYQIFADKTIHFDDVEEIRKAFGEENL